MLLLEASKIKKRYGSRLILSIDKLRIYEGNRIGIVGLNGAGKTTLMNILTGTEQADEGVIRRFASYSYITQLEDVVPPVVDPVLKREFGVVEVSRTEPSGGEKTRLKIAGSLSSPGHLLFADEPTCNLDLEGIGLLEKKIKSFPGALVIISHDRALLDAVCTRIIEIEAGKAREYTGNYRAYKQQKESEEKLHRFEHEKYIKEKDRLLAALAKKRDQAGSIKKAPSRMGNSEARLHKRKAQEKKGKLEKSAGAIKTRIEQLESKEKPVAPPRVIMDYENHQDLHCKLVIGGKGVYKSFGARVVLDGVDFAIYNGSKVALIGQNGSGKTTLIRMILAGEEGIELARGVRIGYFSQNLDQLDQSGTVLENVMSNCVYSQSMARTILARLLFKRDEVYKKVGFLSGGERVKVALASILTSGCNVLILDEPANYLDVFSLEALEGVLKDFAGTLLFVSHDREFIDRIADQVIVLENKKAFQYPGNYTEYLSRSKPAGQNQEEIKAKILQLENRLSLVIGLLSAPPKGKDISNLDQEYKDIIKEIGRLRDFLLK